MSATTIKSGGIASFSVSVDGSTIPDESSVLKVHVEKGINRISTAIVTILDGEANTGDFEASSSATFVPGGTITIEAGYDGTNKVIFKGIITRQSIRIDSLVGSALEVECRDEAIKMVVGRKSLTYSKKTDSAIISSIIGNYSGLKADVTSTSEEWPEQVQYYVRD